jgi:D-alanine-D-alanine ligase
MAKINLALICGGKSAEHEVSLISAKNVIAALDFNKYNLFLFAVTKNGAFRFYADKQNFLDNQDNPDTVSLKESAFSEVAWLAADQRGQAMLLGDNEQFLQLDVVFPIMHGSFAEDGKMQGFLEMLNLPYVGPDVLASAISMDKEITKKLSTEAGVKISKYLSFETNDKEKIDFQEVKEILSLPVFIKPANAGSSVGISKASDEKSFIDAVDQAFHFDHKILIEEAIVGRELECSVLGNREKLIAGEVGEIVPSAKHGFYSYEAKYLDESGAALLIPAVLEPAKKHEIQELAKKIFAACQCEGMSRVDFFMTEDGEVVFNEINTIPGFTKISMYPKLMMSETGMTYGELIDELIDLAIKRHSRNSKILFVKKMVK